MSDREPNVLKEILVYTNAFLIVFLSQPVKLVMLAVLFLEINESVVIYLQPYLLFP